MSEVQQIEIELNYAKEQVKLRADLDSLFKNRAFSKLIVEGFLRDYPAELVRSLADPVISADAVKFAEVQRDLAGIAVLHAYLARIRLIGDMAARSIEDSEAELESMRHTGE